MTRKCHKVLAALALALIAGGLFAADEAASELAVKRENVFEFAQKPKVRRNGDRIDIEFESKAKCDVSVAIENASGVIVRHLASGLLGLNAPEPLQRNSLSQKLVWDGKDDFGVYVDDKDACTVRVSLGLQAKYEKNLYQHPKRRVGMNVIVVADQDGVYLYEANMNDFISKFDHDGNYIRMLYPFAADQLKAVNGLKFEETVPDKVQIPVKGNLLHTTLLPFYRDQYDTEMAVGDIAIRDGIMALCGKPNLARVGTDGTTRGQPLVGPRCPVTTARKKGEKVLPRRAAFSADGQWIYMARVYGLGNSGSPDLTYYCDNGVYRVAYNSDKEPELFLGESAKGSDDKHFHTPAAVAVDRKGRIYVADWDNDRVQVFEADGKLFKTLKVNAPAEVILNPANDEIFVATWQLRFADTYGPPESQAKAKIFNARAPPMLRRFSAIEEGRLLSETPLPPCSANTRLTIDFWAKELSLWLVQPLNKNGLFDEVKVFLYSLQGNKLALKSDFTAEAEKEGFRTKTTPFQRQYLFFDSKRETLYVGEPDGGEDKIFQVIVAIDVKTGATKYLKLPAGAADAAFDAAGTAYLRIGNAVARYDPQTWKEIPYDYGEERRIAASVTTTSTNAVACVTTPGGGASANKYGAMGVSPRGDVIVSCASGFEYSSEKSAGKGAPVGVTKWSPVLYPGRPMGMYVHVYDQYGQIKHNDVLKGIGTPVAGLDMDWKGNIYAGVRQARNIDGKAYGANAGTLVKFEPEKSRFLTDGPAFVPLDTRPDRPRDMGAMWAEGALWKFGGTAAGSLHNCWCRQGRFKTDYFGRCFVPEAWRHSVAVLDSNGNVIMRIGRYGNADSAGPASRVPLGGDEIGLFIGEYVAVHTDRRLFIADVGNQRIVSALLDYHTTETVRLKEVPDAARQ